MWKGLGEDVIHGIPNKNDMAKAAAAWWADRLDPSHGWTWGGESTEKLVDDEVERFKHTLAFEIDRFLDIYPETAAKQWLATLRVVGMNHTGIIADVAEQTDLTGIIYHLPRASMELKPESFEILVDTKIVWKLGFWREE